MGAEATSGEAKRGRCDKERTRQGILDAAREEFAEHGLSGARVEAIAARTHTVKRMLYYYFGSKEGLYLAVLEQAYAAIREAEQRLDLLSLQPVKAIRRLIEFTFDYQEANPGFIRLVSIENIHNGAHMAQSGKIRKLNSAVVETLAAILERGQKQGVFRSDVDAVDVHMLISAFCFFRVSNRHTFGLLFGRDGSNPALRGRHKRLATDAVLRALERRNDMADTHADEDGEKNTAEKKGSHGRAAAA